MNRMNIAGVDVVHHSIADCLGFWNEVHNLAAARPISLSRFRGFWYRVVLLPRHR